MFYFGCVEKLQVREIIISPVKVQLGVIPGERMIPNMECRLKANVLTESIMAFSFL